MPMGAYSLENLREQVVESMVLGGRRLITIFLGRLVELWLLLVFACAFFRLQELL